MNSGSCSQKSSSRDCPFVPDLGRYEIFMDQFKFLGNWPPTPPLSQHAALSEK